MSIDRQQVALSGNERLDLPDLQQIIQDAQDDLRRLIANYVDDSARRVLKNYVQGTSSGLNFAIRTDVERGFHDLNQEWVVKTPDSSGSQVLVGLSANATNYVEVAVNKFTDNLQPRAFWDVDIGLTGSEFFDSINIRERIDELFQTNTSGFSAGAVPLFIVTTNGTGITAVDATPQDLLWKPRSFSLPSLSTRSQVYQQIHDLRSFIDLVGALIGEAKGTGSTLETVPWASLKLLKEYQNMFIGPEVVVTFEGTYGSNNLNWAADIHINIAGRSGPYVVPAQTIAILDQQCIYVVIPEAAPSGPLTTVVTALTAVPLNPTNGSQDARIQVLFFRDGNTVFGIMDLPPLDAGESDTIGQDLPTVIRARLGITSETTFEAYTSHNVISLTDTYPEAISKLDNELGAIINNNPAEAYWNGDGTTTQFDISTATVTPATFVWTTDNTHPDIVVDVDGRKLPLDPTLTNGGYRKLTTTKIELAGAPDGAVGGSPASLLTVRREGTSYGGPSAPSSGNLWSDPVDHDILGPDLGFNIGSASQRFLTGHFQTIYANQIIYPENVGNIEKFKSKVNGSISTIGAGLPVALYMDGKIYPANADAATGQRMIGITVQAINPGSPGEVYLFNGDNIPGILTGMSFVPSKRIYVDSTGAYVQEGTGAFDSASQVTFVGYADCADGAASVTVTDLIASRQEIASP